MTEKKRGYALFGVIAVVFLLLVLLGVAMIHIGYFSEVANVFLRRTQTRTVLVSYTNFALKWLTAELKTGIRPRANAVNAKENLTDSHSLRIFSSNDSQGGLVEVYDMGYDPEKLMDPVEDFLLLPPAFPDGYMIRALAEKEGQVSVIVESVYRAVFTDIPGMGVVYVLEEQPLLWRELLR